MSKKQWMVLLMLFLTYLLLGASIFYHIESHLEIERVEKAKRERIEINALLHAHYVPSVSHDHDEILGKLTRYCGKSVYNYTEGETDPIKWDFYNSFYFAYTVVSTIGYGNLAPTNMLGRILMIFYGLIGIPMNGILLTQLGEFFGHVFVKAHKKYKSYKHSHNDYYSRKLTTFETRKLGLTAQIFAHLMPGFVMFIFFPAFLFSYYEGWSYDEAVYYAFVTLTTIGFGDYVAGQDNSKGSGILFMLYKSFLICWISFGLGYTVMIMTFIARGMRSKKITRIEHKLAINLKHTQSKIWNEFNKEISYLRRVFNELQLSKVKRVYVDECNCEILPSKYPRSNSFPDLRDLLYGSKEKDRVSYKPRRRANSEVVPMEDQLTRVVSETDLQRIDKTATFATHAMVQPAELLARLVNILGYIPPATEDIGGDGSNQTTFLGHDIDRNSRAVDESGCGKDLSEKTSAIYPSNYGPGIWTIGQEKIPRFPRRRSRAASEIRLYEARNVEKDESIERTWSGPTAARKIHELTRARADESANRDRDGVKESSKKLFKLRSIALTKSVPKALLSSGPWKSRFSTCSEKKSAEFESEFNKKDVEQPFAQMLATTPSIEDRRDSIRTHYYTHTGAGNSQFSSRDGANNLLEETSLADFLRAITVLHASVATNGSWAGVDQDEQIRRSQPRRKMGTASLTPPQLPSLFTLFSPSPPLSTSQSNQNTVTEGSNVNWTESKLHWPETRRESRRDSFASVITSKAPKLRRFSLRPVATPISPPTPPRIGSPLLSVSPFAIQHDPSQERTNSIHVSSEFQLFGHGSSANVTLLQISPFVPQDSRRAQCDNKSVFLFESPKEPLIRTEGAPGLSSPVKPPINARRFSLRSTQNRNIVSTGDNAGVVPTLKSLPRWKAGMLQRQIGQMNLQRRARAFSLSDVYTDDSKERTNEPFSCLSSIYRRNNRDATAKTASLHERSADSKQTIPVELSDHPTSLKLPEEWYSSSTQGTTSSKSVRVDEKNLQIIDLCAPTRSIALASSVVPTNELTACSQSDNDRVKIESSFSKSVRTEPMEQTFPREINRTHYNTECGSFAIAATAAAADSESQQSLAEVKVENPGATTIRYPFTRIGVDDLRNNFLDLTALQVENPVTNPSTSES